MGETPTVPPERIVMSASVEDVLAAAEPWPRTRAMVPEDIPWLAEAVWELFPHVAPFTDWDAVVDLTQRMFRGELGDFMPVASPVALTDDGYIAGALASVGRFTGRPDAPDCPYILACLTLPDHRRKGVAAGLLAAAARAAKAVGESRLALTVDEPNDAARALYARHGFVEEARLPAWA
ncbi:MAG: GNAT family N-acetyltransferase [Actinomycetes bacterium]|nr:GNAT family N-acetyltransferase [Actinomycetes bacterium]